MTKKTTPGRTPKAKSIDSDAVRQLADLLDETGLTEIEYEEGSVRIRVARDHGSAGAVAAPPQQAAAPASAAAPAEEAAEPAAPDPASHPGAVTSPMVGTVYLAPEPGAPNFVVVGDAVSEGQTLMLVEAMKTFNEIKAPRAGNVAQILVENAQPVEFGDVLIIVE